MNGRLKKKGGDRKKRPNFETKRTWCLAAAAAAAAGFILDDEEGIVAILESHAIPREEGDPEPRSTDAEDDGDDTEHSGRELDSPTRTLTTDWPHHTPQG